MSCKQLQTLFPDIDLSLAEELFATLGAEHFIAAEAIAEKYHSDWAFDQPRCPLGLMLPSDTQELSSVLASCNKAGQAIVIQGGLTGLASGSTPKNNELALSLERINGIESVDKNSLTMVVKAGTRLADIHAHLQGTGLCYGVDYGARQLCQIGGNAATNAGGTQVIHYGMTRDQILGLEVVLADGTVIDSMNQLLKNNAGYDLKQLFIGSEGTLGVISRLVLRLYPEATSQCTGLFALSDYKSCLILLNLCRSLFGDSLHGFELMWKDYYQTAVDQLGAAPLPHDESSQFYALVELRGRDTGRDQAVFHDLFKQCLEQDVLIDGAIAETAEDADKIWQVRYAVKALLKTMKPLANFDIGIATSQMANFAEDVRHTLEREFAEIETLFFGHIGDGNVHLLASTGNEQDVPRIYELVYPICAEFGGTVSAEHGIGTQKKSKLALSRTHAEIELMKVLKRSMDPKGILNPGRIFDLDS